MHSGRSPTAGLDTDHDSRDPAGAPFPLRAVADDLVVVAHAGWAPGDPSKGGNLLMLWLPSEGLLACYAHLDVLSVAPGQLVARGDRLGTIGRTGVNAYARRSPTHLHFATIGDRDFVPHNPYQRLLQAEPMRAPPGL